MIDRSAIPMHQLVRHEPQMDALAELREAAPVVRVEFRDGPEAWLITRYREAKQALVHPSLTKDHSSLTNPGHGFGDTRYRDDALGRSLQRHLLNSEGAEHRRFREVYSPFLGPRNVGQWRPHIESTTASLLDQLGEYAEPDLLHDFAEPLTAAMMCHIFGFPESVGPAMITHVKSFISGSDPAQVAVNLTECSALLTELILAKRGHPDGSLASAMFEKYENKQWRLTEVVNNILVTFIGGISTSSTLISSAAVLVAGGRFDAGLLHDTAAAAGLIEEVLRYRSPLQCSTWRFASEDLTIADTVIPAGAIVMVSIGAANHDPEVFDAPATVCPAGRTGPAHLAFGHGSHFCVGVHLARLEGSIAIPALFDKYPLLQAMVSFDQLEWTTGVIEQHLCAVPVRLGHR